MIESISKMLRRDLLSMLALTAAGRFVFPTWLLAEAEELEVTKTDEEWRRLLTPAQYRVLRHEDTEPAGSSPLVDEHRKGVFVCAGCELPLFTSETKFESGTGWPSFFAPFDEAHVAAIRDTSHGMVRIETRCARCRDSAPPALIHSPGEP